MRARTTVHARETLVVCTDQAPPVGVHEVRKPQTLVQLEVSRPLRRPTRREVSG